jgi:hypothetical protein
MYTTNKAIIVLFKNIVNKYLCNRVNDIRTKVRIEIGYTEICFIDQAYGIKS